MKLEAEIQQETDIFQKVIRLAKENSRLARERELAEEKLMQANRQKEMILNAVGEGICGLDLEGKTTFANPAAERILGYKEEELLGKPQHGLIHHFKPDGSPFPREDCHFCAVFNDGSEYREFEDVFWRKDGTSFPVEYVSTPIIENEKFLGAVVTFQDITERKQAEQALRDSETRANAILNNALDGIITIDEKGTLKSFNPAAERLFGYKPSDILGENVTWLIPENFRSAHQQGLKTYLETGVSNVIGFGVEVVGLRKDGSTFPMDLGISEMYLGETRIFTGIMRDITERKILEKKLLSNEQRFRAISESSPVGIFQIDGDGFYIYFNTRWQMITKRTLKDSLGQKWWEIIHPDDKELVFEHWAKCEEEEKTFSLDCRILRPDGEVVRCQIKANFFYDDNGKTATGTIEDFPNVDRHN